MSSRVLKWVIYTLPILAFIFILNSGQVLKRPMGRGDDLVGDLHAIEQAVLAEDWEKAGKGWESAHSALGRVTRRIELGSERDEIQHFYEELARLQGTIQARERGTALEHVSVLKALFDEFGR